MMCFFVVAFALTFVENVGIYYYPLSRGGFCEIFSLLLSPKFKYNLLFAHKLQNSLI